MNFSHQKMEKMLTFLERTLGQEGFVKLYPNPKKLAAFAEISKYDQCEKSCPRMKGTMHKKK